MIELVVFDMAGTTINENNVVYKTIQKAMRNGGSPLSLGQVLEIAAGQEKLTAIKSLLNKVDRNGYSEKKALSIHHDFLKMLDEAYKKLKIAPCEGTESLFSKLKKKNIKIALNTGYSRNVALNLIKKLNWIRGKEYDLLTTASDVEKSRPYPDMIIKSMANLGITNSYSVVKVGDSIIDIVEGKAANVGITVGMTTGAHTRKQLISASPNYVFNHIEEILEII